jgi:preprotein translocase subunit SecD
LRASAAARSRSCFSPKNSKGKVSILQLSSSRPILGGSGQVSGNFTVQQANQLAVLLHAGALPAELTVAEERVVPRPSEVP